MGLLTYAFDRRLVELEAMRQKARTDKEPLAMYYITPFHRYGEVRFDEEMQRKARAESDRQQRVYAEKWMRGDRERVWANVIEHNKRAE